MSSIVIQARMGSSRLPGKVLRPLGERSVLAWVVRAAESARLGHRIVVATTCRGEDEAIAAEARRLGVEVVRGPEHDVLSRFALALRGEPEDAHVVRLTADCPLLDPDLIRGCVRSFQALGVEYLSTLTPRSLPRGMDVEVASIAALLRADEEAKGVDRAHVTSYLYRRPDRFRIAGLTFFPPSDDLRVTLDTQSDAAAIEAIVREVGDAPPSWRSVVSCLRHRPDIVAMNADVNQKSLEEG